MIDHLIVYYHVSKYL